MPPADTVLLRDTGTGAIVPVPLANFHDAIASGRYETYGGSTVSTVGPSGGVVESTPEEALGHVAVGEATANEGERMVEETLAAQRSALSTPADKVMTFAEGVVDAMSLGTLHEHGTQADLRRDVNSGSAFMGELAGTALGLNMSGPLKWAASAGEEIGRAAVRAAIGEATGTLGNLALRAGAEAGMGASMMGAAALGHQVSDAVIENKPMAAEAILHEVGVGGLLGGAFGLLGGVFSRATTHADVAAGAGTAELTERAAVHLDSAVRQLDDTLARHSASMGVVDAGVEAGAIDPGAFAMRKLMLNDALAAQEALREAGTSYEALTGDAKVAGEWQAKLEDYHKTVMGLDEAMRPQLTEVLPRTRLGEGTPAPDMAPPSEVPGPGQMTQLADELNRRMAGSPALRDAYTMQMGGGNLAEGATPTWEPLGGEQPAAVPDNLGGEVTPTSELKTGAERPRRSPLNTSDIPAEALASQQFAVLGERHPWDMSVGEVPRAKEPATAAPAQPEAAKKYWATVNQWIKNSEGIRVSTPGDMASAAIDRHMSELVKASGARLDSAGALELGKAEGLPHPTTQIGERFQQVRGLNKAAKLAAEASRSPVMGNSLADRGIDWAASKAGAIKGNAGGAALGGLLGHAAGGGLKSAVGMALGARYMGFAGRVAGTIGRVTRAISTAGDAILRTSTRSAVAARAVAGNRPWAYSDAGPIQDPMQRIVELHYLAANPAVIQAKVAAAAGDLAATQPEILEHLVARAIDRIQKLSFHAPKFAMDRWGNPIAPAAGQMRRWLEYENGANDLLGTITAFERGTVTRDQAAGFRDGNPEFSGLLARQLLNVPETLQDLPPQKIRLVEMATGMNLTTDGLKIIRQQSAWMSARAAGGAQQPSQPAQALKISPSQRMVAAQPLPSQSYSGRAPGN